MHKSLSSPAALEFVREHGIVLASAKGAVPRLIEAILGERITGNWWSHPQGSFIFNVLAEVTESDEVLVCRLLGGKVTLIHRRLWPALVRAAEHFAPARLARVREVHLLNGRHATTEVPFPDWVPTEVSKESAQLSEEAALAALGPAVEDARVMAQKQVKRGQRGVRRDA